MKRTLYIFLLVVLLFASVALAALPATDSFTGTDSTALQTYSANWTMIAGNMEIWQNTAIGYASGALSFYYWNADTPNANQSTKVTVPMLGGGVSVGPACRVQTSAHSGYGIHVESNGALYLNRYDAGTEVNRGSVGAGSVVAGNTVTCEAEGTTIRAKINTSTAVSVTDATYSTGRCGLSSYGASGGSTNSRIDDFVCDNIGGGSPRRNRVKVITSP